MHLEAIKWSAIEAEESFFLSPARLTFARSTYKALIYKVDPETKHSHQQANDMIEIIAEPVRGVKYGDRTIIHYNPKAFFITPQL